MERRNDEAAN
jgi:hypothetical protein